MFDVCTHVIPSIIKLDTVMFRINKKIRASLNINIQITTHFRTLPWHTVEVLGSIGSKSSRRQFETQEERK